MLRKRREKANGELQAFEAQLNRQVCYCQDEGSYKQSYGICPIHCPTDPKEIKKIVMYFALEEYERGYNDAISKMEDSLKEIQSSDE